MTRKLRDALVLALALAAACVDALSYMGLNEVLTANMTGNTVLLGLAMARQDAEAAARSGLALAAFACGAATVALLPRRPSRRRPWPRSVTAALGAEVVLLAGLAGVWLASGGGSGGDRDVWAYLLIALAATAMGAQSAAVTRLGLRGVATTYVTGTVTSLATDVVTRERGSGRRLRLGVLGMYILGAVIGGAAFLRHGAFAALIPALVVAVVAGVAATSMLWPGRGARGDDTGRDTMAP